MPQETATMDADGGAGGKAKSGAGYGWAELLEKPYGARLTALSAGIGLHAFNEVAIAPVIPLALQSLQSVVLLPFIYATFFATVICGGLSASPMRRRFGARRALMIAGCVYLAGILAQSTAPGALLLLLGRALQGLADGWIVALCYTLIADLFPSRLVPRVFSAEALVWALAAVVGPFAGGMTVEMFGWRLALAVSIPVVALFFLVMPFALPQESRAKQPSTPHRILPPQLFALKGTVGRGSWLLFLMTVAQSVSTVFLAFTLNRHLGLAPVRVGLVLITLSLSWSVAALPISGIGSVSKRQVIMRYGPLSQVCGAVLVGTGLYMELLPLVILGQMLNGAAFAMVFASASQAIIEAADPDHRMTTSALLPALETSGYVAGASLIGGAGSLLGFQDGLAAGHPPAGLFALWGVAALIALLAFVAARSVHLKRPDEVL